MGDMNMSSFTPVTTIGSKLIAYPTMIGVSAGAAFLLRPGLQASLLLGTLVGVSTDVGIKNVLEGNAKVDQDTLYSCMISIASMLYGPAVIDGILRETVRLI